MAPLASLLGAAGLRHGITFLAVQVPSSLFCNCLSFSGLKILISTQTRENLIVMLKNVNVRSPHAPVLILMKIRN